MSIEHTSLSTSSLRVAVDRPSNNRETHGIEQPVAEESDGVNRGTGCLMPSDCPHGLGRKVARSSLNL
jgi:hypothetical protein